MGSIWITVNERVIDHRGAKTIATSSRVRPKDSRTSFVPVETPPGVPLMVSEIPERCRDNLRCSVKGAPVKRIIPPTILCSLLVATVIPILSAEAIGRTDEWRRRNDRGNRYEGRIEIPVGRPDLELLSFVGFQEAFDHDVTLKVRFFLPSHSEVFIQGRELQEQKQYWMESKPSAWKARAWNEFGPWPTREVLGRDGTPWWNLGVVIRLRKQTTNGGELVPAFVYHSTLPRSVTEYIVYLRPNSTLKKVTWSLYRIANNQKVEMKTLWGEKIAGEPFSVTFKVRGVPEGPMVLHIQGKFKNRMGGPIREYKFYHKPGIHTP